MPDKDNFGAVLTTGYRWQNNRVGLQENDAVAALRASLGSSGFSEMNHPVVAQANTLNQFDTGERDTHAVAFHPTQDPISSADGSTHCMGTGSGQGNATVAIAHAMTVRRLTPRECERLQGFPDDWTLIPWRKRDASDCPDGPRYKALGNSMAVNCMEWIGERIAAREAR